MDVLGDCGTIEKEMESVSSEMEVVTGLIHSLVDYATVYHDGRIVFQFRNGTQIETKI